jgi:hemoglobin
VTNLYERVGGQAWFQSLVGRFYDSVEDDPVLRPSYPPDMGPARERLTGFLIQYWGWPADDSGSRGHPRLRMRHFRFPIGDTERLAWYRQMAASVRRADCLPMMRPTCCAISPVRPFT